MFKHQTGKCMGNLITIFKHTFKPSEFLFDLKTSFKQYKEFNKILVHCMWLLVIFLNLIVSFYSILQKNVSYVSNVIVAGQNNNCFNKCFCLFHNY